MTVEFLAAAQVATIAVNALAPYLTEAGKEVAKTAGKEVAGQGIKLLGWLRGKLTGRGAEALAELEQAPSDADNQGDVRKQLTKMLTENPVLLEELRALLEEKTPQGHSLIQTVNGDNNKLAQITGDGNSVSIS